MDEKFINHLLRAGKKIYKLIQNGLDESYYDIVKIGAGGDKSTKIDLVAEEIFVSNLKDLGQIISEESGVLGTGDIKIVIDPIDGSDNLISGFPYYGSSVAVKRGDKTFISFIANFANGDFFIKSKQFYKKGSFLYDDYRLCDIDILNSIGRVGLFEKAYANPKIVDELKKISVKFRSPGAVALSLAYAHSVRFVLFVGKIREYDIAAGIHQCEDLNLYYNDRYILVSKDCDLFNLIKREILKD